MGTVMTQSIQNLRLTEDQFALMDMEAGIEHFGRGIVAVSLSADPSIMGEGLMGKELSEKPDAIENLTEFLLSI